MDEVGSGGSKRVKNDAESNCASTQSRNRHSRTELLRTTYSEGLCK